jgi:hypothetical protein
VKLTRLIVLFLFFPIIISGYLPDKGRESDSSSSYDASIASFSSQVFGLIRSEVSKPDYEVFKKAFTGFLNLKAENNIKKNILTIIDLSLSSTLDRMWIIDLNKMEVVHLSLVAHGKKSGEEFASHFSNSPDSHQSSLGFFITGGTYIGSHGISLILDGVEPGINDNARERAIVMHGADYVSRDFIHDYGRLGRSFGCPSIPLEDHVKIINLLSGGSCIYIHYPDHNYETESHMFDGETAFKGIYNFLNEWSGMFYTFSKIHSVSYNQ